MHISNRTGNHFSSHMHDAAMYNCHTLHFERGGKGGERWAEGEKGGQRWAEGGKGGRRGSGESYIHISYITKHTGNLSSLTHYVTLLTMHFSRNYPPQHSN